MTAATLALPWLASPAPSNSVSRVPVAANRGGTSSLVAGSWAGTANA